MRSAITHPQCEIIGVSDKGRREGASVASRHIRAGPDKRPTAMRPELAQTTARARSGPPVPSFRNLGESATYSKNEKLADLESGRLQIGKAIVVRHDLSDIFGR